MFKGNTNRLIVFGIGYFADQIFRYLSYEGIHVTAFTVEKEFCNVKTFHGLPVIPFEELEKHYSKDEYRVLICIGYNEMNTIRERIFEKVKKMGFRISSFIHPSATILTNNLGEGNIVLENVSISIGCSIGNGNIFYNNAVICHDVSIDDFNYFSPSSTVLGEVTIRNNCFFGGNSTCKNRITIEDYCLIGANSFVNDNTQKNEVIVPAKSIVLDCDSFSLVEKLM